MALDIFAFVLGLSLAYSGIMTIVRQRAVASLEGEAEKTYTGGASILLGVLWFFLGLAMAAIYGGSLLGLPAAIEYKNYLSGVFS